MTPYKAGYSLNTLIQLIVFSLFLALIIIINLNFIKAFYFEDQLTSTGIIINLGIVAIFTIGMIKVIYLLLHYWREEKSVARFIDNVEQNQASLSVALKPKALILQRYRCLVDINKQKAKINQSALASVMIANESTRLSLPRYISNILILCGVFGTIISLSIALLGASNLLENSGDISGMGNVIHGMSTALSTTTTAIVCYLFFGYFFQRLTDVQTHLFSGIELVTTQLLLPRFSHQNDNIMSHLTELVSSLNQAAIGIQSVQKHLLKTSQQAENLMSKYDLRINKLSDDVGNISYLLQQGFRLPAPGKHDNLSNSNNQKHEKIISPQEHLNS